MHEFLHRIGEINFNTTANIEIPRISERSYVPFIRGSALLPDVIHNIVKVSKKSARSGIPENLSRILSQRFNFSEKDLSWVMGHCGEIGEKMEERLTRPGEIKIIIQNDFLRIFDFASSTLDVFISSDGMDFNGTRYASEPFVAANLRLIFSSFMTSFSSLLLHCAGLILGPGAAIFFAPDEGGKTTVVSLSGKKFPVLNDDQVILKDEGGTIYAHGTPFGAFNSGPIKAELKGIFMLKQADFFKIEPLSPLEIIECIWGEHIGYTHFLPLRNRQAAFNILYDALHQAPVYNLYFQEHAIDWNKIESALGK